MSALLESDSQSTEDTNRVAPSSISESSNGNVNLSTAPLQLPNLALRSAFVAGAKAAARLNATLISQREHDELLSERQTLLDKLFSGDMTVKEENRLQYVRWSLDRIEDAKHGSALDFLEAQAAAYENLRTELDSFYKHLDSRIKSYKK